METDNPTDHPETGAKCSGGKPDQEETAAQGQEVQRKWTQWYLDLKGFSTES